MGRANGGRRFLFSRSFSRTTAPITNFLGQQSVQFIHGVAKVRMQLQQVGTLATGMVEVDESGQPENPPPVPDVVATYGRTQPLVQLFQPIQVSGGLFQQVASLKG